MKSFTITFLLVMGACFSMGQNVLRYNFNGSLAETNGAGPTLTVLGNPGSFVLDTLNEILNKTKTVYRFEQNSGFQFDNAAAGNFLGNSYTLEIYFVFDNLSSWKRVVDWKNRKTDNGAYVYFGQLNFYNYIYSGAAPVAEGEYTYYVVTRDGSTGALRIYTDGGVQVEFNDVNGDGILDADHVLNFFYDDLVVPNEASAGAAAMINLYNYVLDSTTVRQNWTYLNSNVFGIHDPGKESVELTIRPNPCRDAASLDLSGLAHDGPVTLTVTGAMGNTVLTDRRISGTLYTLNTRDRGMLPGVYMVKAESDRKVAVRKLVVVQ